MTTRDDLKLEALAGRYEILAEVRAHGDTRAFLGRCRDDGANVLVSIVRSPPTDERNALTHFAADVNLLASLRHRCLLRVLEGRWLDPDTFVVVTERPTVPPLEELLARGEQASPTRIAVILRELGGLLAWAREHGVVHRVVTPGSVFIAPQNDRVHVSFVVRPLPITGVPGPEGDARTIAALAWTLLTRDPNGPFATSAKLGDLRPDLPNRLIVETERLLAAGSGDVRPDEIRDYVALVAMVDALRLGEDEAARIRTELHEEQRVAREWLASERHELERLRERYERVVAFEREELERALARQRKEFVKERSRLAREILERRRQLRGHHARLERELSDERDRLMTERTQLEDVRAEIERRLAALAAERAALAARAPAVSAATETPEPEYMDVRSSRRARARLAFATTTALAALVVATAFAVAQHRLAIPRAHRPPAMQVRRVQLRTSTGRAPAPGRVLDSAAGRISGRSAAATDSASGRRVPVRSLGADTTRASERASHSGAIAPVARRPSTANRSLRARNARASAPAVFDSLPDVPDSVRHLTPAIGRASRTRLMGPPAPESLLRVVRPRPRPDSLSPF